MCIRDRSYGNSIMLGATAEETAKLIKKSPTDSERRITFDPIARPQVSALLTDVYKRQVHHLPFGIGCIHDHAVSGIDSHMRDVHVSSVWFVAPEHKVPRLQ